MKRTALITKVPLVAVLAVVLSAGVASARYFNDGSAQNGTTGGWNAPTDFVCVVGLHTDGTMDIADGVTDRHTCQYLTKGTMNGGTPFDLSSMTSQNACTRAGSVGNDGAKHAWATSICVDGTGAGLSLKDLDRTQQMCTAIGGTWVTSGVCAAYTAQFAGQDADGTPLAFGPKGTTSATAGFCYASMDWTAVYPVASCPSLKATTAPFDADAAYDWSVSSGQCRYAKSIAGKLASTLTQADGVTTTPAGTFVDLSTLTTMGDCLAFGASWNNWAGTAATVSVVVGPDTYKRPGWDYQAQAPDADNGCLHCHSTLAQYNGPAERWKDSYLKTGHKNMLRKVTAGKNWAGPDANGVLQIYTDWAAGTLDFSTATATKTTAPTWTYPLLYIFGDWMAPAPAGLDVIVNVSGSAKYNGSSNYSCAPCHSTGWSDNATAPESRIGLCVPSSGGTNQAACTGAGGTWYPAIGVKGIGNSAYVAQEPAASFPGITFASAGQWDVDGITCARCHNAAVGPVTAQAIAASQFRTTYPTSGGMGNIPGGPSAADKYGVFLCYGCHQQVAKTNNGAGADDDLSHPENIPVTNAATAPAYVPAFPGGKHVLGGMFLNSVHAEATGSIVPNSLGKYDLVTNLACTAASTPYACCTGPGAGTCLSFSSTFTGYTCWQSSSSSSPALTWIDATLTTQGACEAAEGEWSAGSCIREIKDKTTCESLYGAGAWRAPTNGSCVTCHDVHNSLFVAEQEEKALRKTCENCHVDNATTSATVADAPQMDLAKMHHLMGPGTPFDPSVGESPCVVCHMPTAPSGGFPFHLWRINTDVNYSTFPTAAQYFAATPRKILNTSPDGSYTNAVWTDVDLACGQCHGGGTVTTTTGSIASGATALTVSSATNILPGQAITVAGAGHLGGDLNSTVASVAGLVVTLNDAAQTTVSGAAVSVHNPTTALAGYIPKAALAHRAEGIHGNNAINPSFGYKISSPNTLQITAYAMASCGGPCSSYAWDWGDGGTGTGATAIHAYAAAGTYQVTLTVTASGGGSGSVTRSVTVYQPDFGPTAAITEGCGSILGTTNWNASLADASTDSASGGDQVSLVTVSWGDGSLLDTGPAGMTFTHTYRGPGVYKILHKAVDNIGQQDIETCSVTVAYYAITGKVEAPAGTPIASATVQIINSVTNAVAKRTSTSGSGNYTAGSLRPGSYNVVVTKSGYTFPVVGPIMVGPSSTGNDVTGTQP